MLGMAISTVRAFYPSECNNLIDGSAILLFNDKERKIAEDVVHRMVKRAVEMEGTVTGEHGVGLIKRDYLAHEMGESAVDAMRKVRLPLPSPLPSWSQQLMSRSAPHSSNNLSIRIAS